MGRKKMPLPDEIRIERGMLRGLKRRSTPEGTPRARRQIGVRRESPSPRSGSLPTGGWPGGSPAFGFPNGYGAP